jgi:hypothetical protein
VTSGPDTYDSQQLWAGALVGGGDVLAATQPTWPDFRIEPAPGRMLFVDPHSNALALLDASGAAALTLSTAPEQPTFGTNAQPSAFAATVTSIFRFDAVEHASSPTTTNLYVYPLADQKWTLLRASDTYAHFEHLTADATGAYYTNSTQTLDYTDERGQSTSLASLVVGSPHYDDAVVLGEKKVYVGGGGATVSGRVCKTFDTAVPNTIVRAVPKGGGNLTTLFDLPATVDRPPLKLVGGDDRSLVLTSLPGCDEKGIWIAPSDGSSPPRPLVGPDVSDAGAPPVPRDVRVVGDWVYYARYAGGPLSRVCRRLP